MSHIGVTANVHNIMETVRTFLAVRKRKREQQRRALMSMLCALARARRLPDPLYIPPLHAYSDGYWKRVKMYGDAQFKRHFRITKSNFIKLHSLVYGDYRMHSTAYDTDFRVALFLWRMATTQSCREIAELFSVAQSSVCRITDEVAHRIVDKLSAVYIHFPSNIDELFRLSREWEQLAGFPNVVGAIDGTHIDLDRAPSDQGSAYFDRKKNYSIQMQAVVDHRGIFTSIDIGWPGSVHDARVYSNSDFCRWMEYFIAKEKREHPSHVWYVLGDIAYPLSPWLLTPYKTAESIQGTFSKTFNILHAQSRVPIENAFGRLKGRWKRLFRLDASEVSTANIWIHACVVLHNFCETNNDLLEERVLQEIAALRELKRAEREHAADDQSATDANACDSDDEDCELITDSGLRDGLAMILHEKWLQSRR